MEFFFGWEKVVKPPNTMSPKKPWQWTASFGDLFWGRLVSDLLRDPHAGKVTSKRKVGEDESLVNFAEESSMTLFQWFP